ncbi:MAG: hypothetical protein PF569_00360 [Candidatus Woesearchaeota archaeon]|jgi:hypothetical protein|nr:hypothetical protein [Candidatus Woesearchaeota archaeon]
MKTEAKELKTKCYELIKSRKYYNNNSDGLLIIALLEDILEREVMLDINLLFNEGDSHITKKDYGYILVCRLVEDLAKNYLKGEMKNE